MLCPFAPSARAVASKVEQHRKATAALLLPSAALEPKVGRVWRKTGAVSLCRRPVFLSRGTQRSLRRRVRLSVARRVAVVAAFQFLERMCRFKLRFKLHSAGRWDRSSPSSSLSAQFSLSNSSLAVTSSEVSRFCESSSSFARRGAFFEELAVSSQKLRGSGRNLPVFLPKVRRCFPPPRPFSAQRVAVCKKIPRCLPDSGGMSFAARIAGRVTRSGFSTWRRWEAIA